MTNPPVPVLLIEDNPGDARLIREMLAEDGGARFALDHAERLATGLAAVTEKRPAVILLDLSLPDSAGLATLHEVQTRSPEMPIVVLTGHDDEELALQAVREGAQDYLIKGQVNSQLLVRAIRYATERKRAEEALRKSEELYRLLAENASDVIWVLDVESDTFRYISPSVERLRGYTAEEAILQGLVPALTPTSLQYLRSVVPGRLERFRQGHLEFFTDEIEQLHKDGHTIWTEVTARYLVNRATGRIESTGVTRDITERKRLQEELQRQATTDELTGIANRRHFIELAHGELKRAIRLKHPLAIALIDIDLFKYINDTYGHAAGDQALVAFTKICQKSIREIDVFARFGGDEFALLLPETNLEQAYEAMERVRLALTALPFDLIGKPIAITISMGIASLTSEQDSLDALLGRADQALYRAKEVGRNRIEVEPPTL